MVSTGTQYQVQFNRGNGLDNLIPTKLQAPIPKDNGAEDSWPPNNQDKLKQAKSTYNGTVQTVGGSLVSTGTQHEAPWPKMPSKRGQWKWLPLAYNGRVYLHQ